MLPCLPPLALFSVGLFTYFGADPPWVGGGRPFSNEFYDNQVTNTRIGVKLKDSDGISIKGREGLRVTCYRWSLP